MERSTRLNWMRRCAATAASEHKLFVRTYAVVLRKYCIKKLVKEARKHVKDR